MKYSKFYFKMNIWKQ